MKQVFIIGSSPRKDGNSDILCNHFAQGAREAGHEVIQLFLRDRQIACCIACDACKRNGGICAIKDDMAAILQEMKLADVIVLASPVYFYSVNAQMKAMIDRCVADYLALADKTFYFIATAAEQDVQALATTFDCLRGFTDCLPNAHVKGVIQGHGAWERGDVMHTNALQEAYRMGSKIA